jgi:anaerobic selenocysteine-containing dehydrogenase
VDQRALERPDLLALSDAPRPRSINMSAIGDALLELRDPPVKAIYVYNSNPLAVAPDSSKVAAGFARRDLFCVVHDIFVTDTADYADILLPATTQLEQADIHRAYGHRYVQYSEQAIAPVGEAKPNSEVFRLLAQRMGYSDACLQESDEDIMRAAFKWDHAAMQGISFDSLKQHGWQRLQGAVAPYAEGGFQTPSGKCEFESAWLAAQGFDALPTYIPPHESVQSNAVLAERYPLAMISPPARHALNSSFANLPVFLEQEKMPCLALHPQDAAERGITEGSLLRVFNDRGSLQLHARISERARPGVVVALSLWWNKLSGNGANANVSTASIKAMLTEGLDAKQAFLGNKKGDVETAIAGAVKKVEAVYRFPYQHHMTMGLVGKHPQLHAVGVVQSGGVQFQVVGRGQHRHAGVAGVVGLGVMRCQRLVQIRSTDAAR